MWKLTAALGLVLASVSFVVPAPARADDAPVGAALPDVYFGVWRAGHLFVHPGYASGVSIDTLPRAAVGPFSHFEDASLWVAPVLTSVVPEPMNGMRAGTVLAVFDARGGRCEGTVTRWVLALPYDPIVAESVYARDASLWAEVAGCAPLVPAGEDGAESWWVTERVWAVAADRAPRVVARPAPVAEHGVRSIVERWVHQRGGHHAESLALWDLGDGLSIVDVGAAMADPGPVELAMGVVTIRRAGDEWSLRDLVLPTWPDTVLLGAADLDGDGRPELIRTTIDGWSHVATPGEDGAYSVVRETEVVRSRLPEGEGGCGC